MEYYVIRDMLKHLETCVHLDGTNTIQRPKSQNWSHFYVSCFSPLAAHWFTNNYSTNFVLSALTVSARPLLVYLIELLKQYKPTRQLRSSHTFILCVKALAWSGLFLMLHCLSAALSLAKSGLQTQSNLSDHIQNLTSSSLSLIHIWRCRRGAECRSRWSPYH